MKMKEKAQKATNHFRRQALMQDSSLSKTVTPFVPRAFPPRKLQRKLFSADLLKAKQALKEYSSALRDIPFLASFLSPLMTLEAMASLDARRLKITLSQNSIFHYAQALSWACKNISKTSIDEKLLCTLHKKIKQGTAHKSDLGVYRKKQNWIGPKGCTIEQAYFYPPAPKQVRPLMQEMLRYCRRKEREPLLQLALVFAQLLIIHPFMDGNGRVARILIPLFLYQKKIIPFPLLFMSSYFRRHRLRYFQSLYKTTEENQWESWIVFFMKGVTIETKRMGRSLKKIEKLYAEMRSAGVSQKTLQFLFQKPVFALSVFKKAGGTKQQLDTLLRLKWLTRDKKEIYVFNPLMKLFADHLKH
jgi:Fic family protein